MDVRAFSKARAALHEAIAALPYEVYGENVQAAPARTFLRTVYMPVSGSLSELGTGGKVRISGIFQVSVFTPAGEGSEASRGIVDEVVEALAPGTRATHDGVTVEIGGASPRAAVPETNFYHVPVEFEWTAYV